MSLNLEILSTTTIKRKKPWSKTYWIGKEKEQLVLLDSRRVSYLQLHNGETKKNIGHLNRYLEDTIKLFYHDENILALQSSGDILIWNKDSDAIYLVKGLPTFPTTPKGKKDKKSSYPNGDKKRYDITVNNNLRNIAVVLDFNRIFMWCGEKPIFDKVLTSPSGSKKAKELNGSWFTIPVDNEVPLPNLTDDKNGILTTSFIKNHPIITSPFQCVYLYSREDTLRVPILTINPTYAEGYSHFQNNICVWKNYNYPLKDIHPECYSIQHSGALTATLSHNGLTLALAVNQLATQAAKLVFMSVLNGSMVSTSLKNYSVGQSVTMRKKYLWISDISWSYDDCFVVCITKEGSVCVASQLGELLRISLIGCSLKLGPGFYPNLYPLVKPSSKETLEIPDDDESVSTTSGCPNFKQRFSVTSHPRVPLFLLSDGYIVTLIRLPHSHSEVIQTSLWFLQETKIALKPFRQMSGHRKISKFVNESTPKKSVKASLEAADMKESWKILSTIDLTEDNNSNVEEIALKSTRNEWESRQLGLAGSYIVSLWGLLSSYNYSWTKPLYSLASKSVELIAEIVEISLLREISFSSRYWNILQTPFNSVTNFSNDLFEVLGFDCVLYNMLSTSVSVLNKIVSLLSTNNIDSERITSTTRFLLKMEQFLLRFYNVNLSRSSEFFNQRNENENYLLDNFYSYGNFNNFPFYGNLDFQEVTTFQRLKPAWFSLYKRAFSNYRKNNNDENNDEWCKVLCLLQKEIQERGWDINVRSLTKIKKKLDPASQIYLTGHMERATEMWISELKNNKRSSNTNSRKLHRILYSLLSQYNIAVFTFVFGIVRSNFPRKIETNENISKDSKKLVLYSIMKQMDCKNVTKLVQSFARIWLSYYNKKIISIYPVHRAHSILPENQAYKGLRSYPLISSFISDSLSRQKMDVATNPTLVLDLLLLGGLWFESVAFLSSQTNNKIHFRLAFALAAIWSKTNNLIWRARCSIFPPDLEPKNIILGQLKFLPSVSNKDSKPVEECSEEFLSDLLLPAAICGLDLTPVILEDIVDELTRLIEKTTLLVPNETYLPAPPIYCPQQSIGYEEGDMPSEDTEDGFRHSVATLIERFFRVVQASFLGFPLMAWYFSFIEKLWAAAGWNSFGEMAFSNLQFTIVTYLDINSSSPEIANSIQWVTLETSEGGQKCLQSLRNLLSLIWMLNCRDELSIACRNMHRFILGDETKREQNDYFTILDQVLYWSEKIWPFRRIISSPGTLENIVFNTSNEMNFSRDLLLKIVPCFLNPETLSLSGQNQLSYSVPKWETYLSNSTKYELKTFNDYCSREMEKRKLLGERIGKQYKMKCPFLKIGQFEDYHFELEEEFLNIAEPVFHIGILKRLSHSSPSSQTSTPLLTTFAKQLKSVHFSSSTDSIKTLVNLERQSSYQKSLLEFIEEANTTSPQSVLSCETLNFLKTPGKRRSVLFRQPIGSFWSPSRRVVEKFHKLVTEVRSQNFKSKSRNVRKINGNVVSKWKSTANLIVEELSSGRLTNLNKSVSVSNLFSQSILRPTIGKDKGYANKIPDLVVELQMKTNEDESLLPFVTWILSWASNGLSNIHLLPSHVLLALVLESRRKVRVNDGRLRLVKVKIDRSIAEAKKPISRSLSLRIPENLPRTSLVPEAKEAQTLEYFTLSPRKKMEENRPKERETNDVKLPRDFNANLPEKEIKTKTVPPKNFSLPQVYQECWNKTMDSPKYEPSLKLKEKLKTVSPIKTKSEDTLKPIFDRNSPQRHSIRWKKETILQKDNTLTKNAPNEIHQTEEDLKSIVRDAVRMEMFKTAEETLLGIFESPARNDYIKEEPRPLIPIERKESVQKVATQELPQISDSSLIGQKKNGIHLRSKVLRMKERKSSDDATSSAESDRSDFSESHKKKRHLTKKSILHKVPLLKAEEERGKVSPKRYYVISDEKISSPQRRVENRRNLSHPIKLLKIENSNENNLISNESIKKNIDPDEVRRFVVGKVKKEDEEKLKFEKKKLLSVLKPLPSKEKSPSVNECDAKEKPRKQKSLGPKTAAKLAKMSLKLSLDNIEKSQMLDEIERSHSHDKIDRPRIENIKIDNPKPQTPSIVSPDSCAQLQYDVYERLRSAKEKSTNSTQTILFSKDVGISTDSSPPPKISHDIGLMTTPSEAEMESERIRVFQKVLTSSKQTSISDDIEVVIRDNDGIIRSPPNSSKRSLENYDEDISDSNAASKSSEHLTSPQISFSTKLEGLQKRLESIDEISQNLGQELRNSKKTILDAENLANFDVNLNLKEKSACTPEWCKKETNSFEHRKTIILSLIDKKYKNVLSNYETGSDLNDNLSESLTDNYPVDDSAIDSDQVELRRNVIRSRSIGIEDERLIEPAKMRELYRIYGSRRIPERVIQKLRSEYIAKRQSSL